MKTAQGLIEYAKSKIGTPYVYGAKMEILTKDKFNWLQKTYGKNCVWDADVSKIGKMCCDCSGLISSYTGIVQGSAQMKTTAKACYPISEIKNAPLGVLVWQDGHVGVYIGLENGVPMYIAADGSAVGCRKREISKAKFTHYLLMNYIDYTPIKNENNKSKMKISVQGKTTEINSVLVDDYNNPNFRELMTAIESLGINFSYDAKTKTTTITK